jgi:nucleotide-binding universal stress UspA family protein
MRSSIVVGVDGSHAARRAARAAASFARRLDYRLVLAHVASDPPVFPYGELTAREIERHRALERATSLLDSVAQAIGEPAAKKAVVISDVPSGLAFIADNEGAALLAIGSRRDKRWGRPRNNRLATSLEAISSCPVVVVSGSAAKGLAMALPPPVGAVVVGVDGSPNSMRARVVATGLADQLGLPATPVFVREEGSRAVVEDAVSVSNADPATGLADAARTKSASLLVVGASGGRRGAPSVAERLHRTSPVPLVVVPSDAHLSPFVAKHLEARAEAA